MKNSKSNDIHPHHDATLKDDKSAMKRGKKSPSRIDTKSSMDMKSKKDMPAM
jgi:hypothetical protein